MPSATDLKPLSARSVVVSLLLGAHPEPLTARQLVAAGTHVGHPAPTVRVALSRAVAGGDLGRSGSAYHLGERLRARLEVRAVTARSGAWDGRWEMVVVVGSGRPSAERASLRGVLLGARLAELREGVWLRPANLDRPLPVGAGDPVRGFVTDPVEDPVALAHRLWDVAGWACEAESSVALLEATTEPAARLCVAAHLVRHLDEDPLLPPALCPPGWPAARAHRVYAAYQREILAVTRRA